MDRGGDSEKPWKKPWETAGKCGNIVKNVEKMWKILGCHQYKSGFLEKHLRMEVRTFGFHLPILDMCAVNVIYEWRYGIDHSKVVYHQQD